MSELISVILPAYNCADTIGRAIDSIICQSINDWKLIIVYDKSDDNTLDIINRYCKIDYRIELVESKEKKGIAAALNLGIKKAKGLYIARMDADDVAYRDRFEIQLNQFRLNHDVDICGTGFRILLKDKVVIPEVYENNDDIKTAMLYCCPLAHPTVMVRKCVFEINHYDEEAFVEDYELWFRLCDSYKMANIKEVLLDYHFDGENNSIIFKSKVFKKTVACRRLYLKKYLDLELSSFDDEIIGNAIRPGYVYRNKHCLVFLFDYLVQIEKNNQQKHFFNEKSLNISLTKIWNRGVNDAYFWTDCLETGIKLTISEEDRELNWKEKLRKQLQLTNSKDIRDVIIKSIDSKKIPFDFNAELIVYGTGDICDKYMDEYYASLHIVTFSDSDRNKHGQKYKGMDIISPINICKYRFDFILIASKKYYHDIKDYLINDINVPREKIYPINSLNFCRNNRVN